MAEPKANLTVQIPRELYEELRALAFYEDRSLTSIVTEAIREVLSRVVLPPRV